MDLAAEKVRLLERDAEWAALASEGGDVDSIVSYWTDDAVMFPPDLPAVIGKPALREYVQASSQIPGFSITWRSTEVALSPDGNLAYMFGENAVTMDGPDGTPTTIPGRGVTIWRRESDGRWRCAVDIWNAGPA
jgi:ketosteroid isomerase-like protein